MRRPKHSTGRSSLSHKVAQLLYLRRGEKLRLVGDYHVVFPRLVVLLGNVLLRRDYLARASSPMRLRTMSALSRVSMLSAL